MAGFRLPVTRPAHRPALGKQALGKTLWLREGVVFQESKYGRHGLNRRLGFAFFPVQGRPGVNLDLLGDSSSQIRERVEQARANMITRQAKENARLSTREIERYCMPDDKGATLLKQAISKLGLSARGYHRILKVAQTIAALAHVERISDVQVAEAIQYRRFDRA